VDGDLARIFNLVCPVFFYPEGVKIMFEFLTYDVTMAVGVAMGICSLIFFAGMWVRGEKIVYPPGERAPRSTPQLWKMAQRVRDGKDLPALADELDDICCRFRYFMTWGETIYNAHPESDDRKMFRKILDEGWQVYEKFDGTIKP